MASNNQSRYDRIGRLIGFVLGESVRALAERVVFSALVVEETLDQVRALRFDSDAAARRHFDAPDANVVAAVLRSAERTDVKPGWRNVIRVIARDYTPGARIDLKVEKEYAHTEDGLVVGHHDVYGTRDPSQLTNGMREGVQNDPLAARIWNGQHVGQRRFARTHGKWFKDIFVEFMKLKRLPLAPAGRWDADQETGLFVMKAANGDAIVRATFDIVGTYAADRLTWLWGWGNPSVKPERTARVARVREQAAVLGIPSLAQRRLSLVDEKELYELNVAAAMLGGAQSTYRFESSPGVWVYLLLFDVRL